MESKHPEASQYEDLMSSMDFHESSRLAKNGEKRVALIDIDETICFYPNKRQYNMAEPSKENIAKINKLYDEGWYIVYWTARGTTTNIDWRDVTEKQFERWGVLYHELKFNKPDYNIFIDDKTFFIEG